MTTTSVSEEIELRRAAGLKIDPATAEVMRLMVRLQDPYDLRGDLRPEEDCVGRLLFARAPGEVWVSEHELPLGTLNALRVRIEQERVQ